MRRSILLVALLVAGCGPRTETFERASCDVLDTGARSTRQQWVCQTHIKGVCYGGHYKSIHTRQYAITCRRTEWVDQ